MAKQFQWVKAIGAFAVIAVFLFIMISKVMGAEPTNQKVQPQEQTQPQVEKKQQPSQQPQPQTEAKSKAKEKYYPFEGFVGIKGAKYVGQETCETCHDKEAKEFKLSTHSRLEIEHGQVKMQGCEMCHGPGSIHVDAGGGKGNIINPKKNPEACFACHMDKKMEFRLPFHHPVLEGKMSCTDCHSAHGTDVRPWSATTLKGPNETCFKCHKEQRGPFVWEHEALRDGCTTCHKVHGSINDKMLWIRDSNLCLRCHSQMDYPLIGRSNHVTRMAQGTCWSGACHNAVHGSNFDDHLRF